MRVWKTWQRQGFSKIIRQHVIYGYLPYVNLIRLNNIMNVMTPPIDMLWTTLDTFTSCSETYWSVVDVKGSQRFNGMKDVKHGGRWPWSVFGALPCSNVFQLSCGRRHNRLTLRLPADSSPQKHDHTTRYVFCWVAGHWEKLESE